MKLSYTRRVLLARLAKHGAQPERDVCSYDLGRSLASQGWVTRAVGKPGAPTTLEITDAGRALLRPEDQCECPACRKALYHALIGPKASPRRDYNDRMFDIGYKHHGDAFLDHLAGTDEPEEP